MPCYHMSTQKSILLFTDRLFEQKWIVRMKAEIFWRFLQMVGRVVYSNEGACIELDSNDGGGWLPRMEHIGMLRRAYRSVAWSASFCSATPSDYFSVVFAAARSFWRVSRNRGSEALKPSSAPIRWRSGVSTGKNMKCRTTRSASMWCVNVFFL